MYICLCAFLRVSMYVGMCVRNTCFSSDNVFSEIKFLEYHDDYDNIIHLYIDVHFILVIKSQSIKSTMRLS